MLDPYPDLDQLKQVYNSEYNLYQEASKSFLTKLVELFSQSRTDLVKKYIQPPKKILDIGCGLGAFLKEMLDLGYEVKGTEWNNTASQVASEKIGNGNVITSELSQISEKYHIITLWHVLEHNPTPIDLINEIKKLLQPHSLLFIEVPNSSSITIKSSQSNYAWYSIPEHVTYWNYQSLKYFADNNNFEILESSTPFSMPFLYSKSQSNSFSLIISPFVQFYASLTGRGDIIRQVWRLKQ
ncbi:MAG: class I SAM-dependent methyltransferase [bacterium]|nr:class I SAM-dependent methyltransferase [bacterium]